MKTKLLHEIDGRRTFAVILSIGDEAMQCLKSVADEQEINAAQISAIGAFSRAQISFFDWDSKEYRPIAIDEQVEVASFNGDIAIGPDGRRSIHVHVVLGRSDGSARAGHLDSGSVRPTLEIILTELPAHLQKRKDPESGLALIRI